MANHGRIRINPAAIAQLRQKIHNAWAEVVTQLDTEFEAVIRDPDAFSDLGFINQDIVDTERFVNSVKFNSSENKAFWVWDPIAPDNGYHYAAALYYGFHPFGMDGTGGKPYAYCPGRPWIDRAVKNVNPVVSFASELRKQGISAKVTRNNHSLLA